MNHASFEKIRALVQAHSAIVLDAGKEYLVEVRLQPVMQSRGFRSVDELCAHLADGGRELTYEVIEAMTTNETSFFRDAHPFETLRGIVLPQLMRRNDASRRLRIWCAASSTGQEPYSVAITVREHFPELTRWDVQIWATDISRQVLGRARAGFYKQLEVNRGLCPTLLSRYFTRRDSEYQIHESIRAMVRFEELNLIQSWPAMPVFDIVFIRNVLIYFDLPTKQAILTKVRRAMLPGSYLFLGGSESLSAEQPDFEKVPNASAGCYRLR